MNEWMNFIVVVVATVIAIVYLLQKNFFNTILSKFLQRISKDKSRSTVHKDKINRQPIHSL